MSLKLTRILYASDKSNGSVWSPQLISLRIYSHLYWHKIKLVCKISSLNFPSWAASLFSCMKYSAWPEQESTAFVECRCFFLSLFMWFKAVKEAKQFPDRSLDMTMKLRFCRNCSLCWRGLGGIWVETAAAGALHPPCDSCSDVLDKLVS